MSKIGRRRPSGALVVALVALFAALGGTAVASGWVISNINQIKPSVRHELRGNTGPQGAQGPAGPQGPAGATGPAGASGANSQTEVAGASATMCDTSGAACQVAGSVATCPPGTVVAGGGWDGESNPPVLATVSYNKPLGGNAWEVIMIDNSGGGTGFTQSFNAIATCIGGGITAHRAGGLTQAERDQVASQVAAVRAAAHLK
jgi:hypothetical protein